MRVVILAVDDEVSARYWLFRDYFPAANRLFGSLREMLACFPTPPRVRTVPIPVDCHDGFVHAFWGRPEALLEPATHASMAALSLLEADELCEGFARLRADLDTGECARRNHELEARSSLDVGHRLVVWEHPRMRAVVSGSTEILLDYWVGRSTGSTCSYALRRRPRRSRGRSARCLRAPDSSGASRGGRASPDA